MGVSASSVGSRQLLSTEDDINKAVNDAEQEVSDFIEKFWGGICISDDQCLEVVAFCDNTAGKSASIMGDLALDGQCRPVIWIWIALAAVILLLLGSCICCICCGLCSCLYKILCCCCNDKGYTPANTHG